MAAEGFIADIPPRPLTEWEREVISALAPAHDPDALRVHSHCTCGCASVSFVPSSRKHTLLAEAEAPDNDGVPIWFLLFGSDKPTELDELEIQRADATPLRQPPDPRTLSPRKR
jgi:hypothetical protein